MTSEKKIIEIIKMIADAKKALSDPALHSAVKVEIKRHIIEAENLIKKLRREAFCGE